MPVYDNLWWAIDGVLAGMGMPYVHLGETAVEAIAHARLAQPSAVETNRQIRFLEYLAGSIGAK